MDLNSPHIVQEELKYAGSKTAPVFENISADSQEQTPTIIESLCMSCHKQGCTKLMLTRIPFFKEVIIGSFECSHCSYKDSQITSAGEIQEKGVKIALQVSAVEDLNRQIVKSDAAVIKIPQVELEIPAKKGCLTTIEGTINTTCEELLYDQPARRLIDPDNAQKIDDFIGRLKMLLLVKAPFQFIIEDITGNSHVENPKAPSADPLLHTMRFFRTKAQNDLLGIETPNSQPSTAVAHPSVTPLAGEPGVAPINFSDEVMQFAGVCNMCNAPCVTNMKMVNIPRFKQVIIMAMACDRCGYKNNEVKPGAGIEEQGVTYTLFIKDSVDLSRDLLKSDSASCMIPELDLALAPGTLGGRFTTVEGLISNIRDQLRDTNFTFTGDSSSEGSREKMSKLCNKLSEIIAGKFLGEFHMVLDDPTGNSYLQDIYEPETDPCLKVERYERTEEQNEELGLTDMSTESTDGMKPLRS